MNFFFEKNFSLFSKLQVILHLEKKEDLGFNKTDTPGQGQSNAYIEERMFKFKFPRVDIITVSNFSRYLQELFLWEILELFVKGFNKD